MKRRNFLGMAALAAAAPAVSLAADVPTDPVSPKTYYVLMHTPGPKWDHAKHFRDQDGVGAHVGYMHGFFQQGKLVQGGPFLDDSGGMMVFNVATIDEARLIAQADPTVKSGLLSVVVRPWYAAFDH